MLSGGDGGYFSVLMLTLQLFAASHLLSCYNTGSYSAGTALGDPYPGFGPRRPQILGFILAAS